MTLSRRLTLTLILIWASATSSFLSAGSMLFTQLPRLHALSLIPNELITLISENFLGFATLTLSFLFGGMVWKNRALLVIAAVLFSIYSAYLYAHFHAPVPWSYILIPLWGFAFFWRRDNELLFDLIRWSIAWTYFSAGVAKLIPLSTLPIWISGGTIQSIAYDRYVQSPLFFLELPPIFDYSDANLAWGLFAVVSIVIELSTAVMFFTRRFDPLLFVLLSIFHLALIFFGVWGFLEQFLCVALFTMTRRRN